MERYFLRDWERATIRTMLSRFRWALALAVLLLLTLHADSRVAAPGTPRLTVWAWERPEDLRFLDRRHASVAFLAQTISVDGGTVRVRPRFQPLRVPADTELTAVVRIEFRERELPAGQMNDLARKVAASAALPRVTTLQIDFDATVSQRALYRELLVRVRQQLPPATRLTMTALASWCLDDNWLAGLPIDDAVPMLFRMGAERDAVLRRLRRGDFTAAVCRASVGIATDEPLPDVPIGRDVYLFSPHSWTAGEYARMRQELAR